MPRVLFPPCVHAFFPVFLWIVATECKGQQISKHPPLAIKTMGHSWKQQEGRAGISNTEEVRTTIMLPESPSLVGSMAFSVLVASHTAVHLGMFPMGRAKKHEPVLQVKKPQVWPLDAECGAGVEEPVKRFNEPKAERRPWRIWFYDTSKQALGATFVHFANVFLSDLAEEDPCSLYLMNFLLDATLGMLGVWTGVKLVSWIVERRKCTHLVFGEYGDPPQAGAWLGQCALYLLIMVFAKTAVGLLLLIPGWRKLQEILLDYVPDPQTELVLMMLVVPFTVNAATFWVVDGLIMKKHQQKEILKSESSCRTGDSQALKEEEYQALLCPALDFDHSRGDADPLGSLPQGTNSSIKQPDFQDTLGQGFVTKLNGGESAHC